jgi:hypothetical protein
MTAYTVSVNNNQFNLNATGVGAQGTPGNSVSNAYLDSNNDFIIEISNASGTVVQTINVGGGTIAGQLNAFGTTYLGSKTAAPTLDNSGNALIDGALFFNTTTNELGVYDLGTTTWEYPSLEAATSASNAVTSETNAATSEANAATSETNSATSEANAATSETNAATSETNAATSETNAATSETNAATSETNAATSETNAAASETNVENLYDAFDDLFLGPKSSAPTVDNDGDPLLTGALYYDTTTLASYAYNGTSWGLPGLSEEAVEDIVDGLLEEGLGVTLTYDDAANTLTVDVDAIEEVVKNVSGGTLSAGTVVYQSGSTGTIAEVQAADHASGSSMPALGILSEDISSGSEGKLVLIGKVSGLNTSSFSAGATVYVGTSGALQATAPTGEANYIQNIGKVLKVHSTNGSMLVTGAGRTNATPNLNDRQFFIGNTSDEPTTSDFDQEVADVALALSIALG